MPAGLTALGLLRAAEAELVLREAHDERVDVVPGRLGRLHHLVVGHRGVLLQQAGDVLDGFGSGFLGHVGFDLRWASR